MPNKVLFLALTLWLSLACTPGPTTDEPSFAFGECRDRSELQYEDVTFQSFHIPMRDGVRIALDLTLPAGLAGCFRNQVLVARR